MAAINVESIVDSHLSGLDADLLAYVTSVVDTMTESERRNHILLTEAISPFLVDSGFSADEAAAAEVCKRIAIAFGGSGYLKSGTIAEEDGVPALLAAPVRIKEVSGLGAVKATYGGAIINELHDGSAEKPSSAITGGPALHNASLDIKQVAGGARELRRQRKESERLVRVLQAEASAEEARRNEMALARMAAIRASRLAGRQAGLGVNIESFSLPHPSGTGDLLSDAALVLVPGRRYGLIGRNGAGKSTLLRSLANYKLPGLTHLRILLVDQHVEGDSESALQWLLRADVERTSLLEEEARLSSFLHGTADDPLPVDLKAVNLELALAEVYDRMDAIGVSSAEVRAKKILAGLGFDESMIDRPTENLSGGWAMRAALGAAIFVRPNLLLLDEPTNHLDLHALVWLEKWLSEVYQGIAVVVSHDQSFLDEICTDVLELRSTLAGQKRSSLMHYSGDYQTFVATVEERNACQSRLKAALDMKKEKLREFISRDGKKYDNPSHQSQRKMKMKQLEEMEEIQEVEQDPELEISLPRPFGVFDPEERLICAQNISFGWPGESPLVSGLDFSVFPGDRIVLLGKNGSGKTSLLNLFTGEASPTEGSVSRHIGCRIQILQQHHYRGEQLDPNAAAIDHIKRLESDETSAIGKLDPGSRQEETSLRSYLNNFGISGNRAMIPVKYLSGGQRMRVAMAVALYRRPDVLILDEPTNHLDSDTVRALCKALSSYEGTVIAVSHDESFVNKLINNVPGISASSAKKPNCGQIWVLSKCRLRRFDGTFKEYKKLIMSKIDQTV